MGFPRQEYWSGLPFPSPGDLPDPGIKPVSPVLMGRFFTAESPGKPKRSLPHFYYIISSVSLSCPTLCKPMDCSIPGLPVPHHLLEFAQVHVHWIGDAVQSSHPLTLFSPSALNLSQHQGLFQWVVCSHQMTKYWKSVLPVNIQDWSPLRLTGLISLLSKGLSGVFSSTTVWRHQFFGALPSLQSSFIHTLYKFKFI